MLRKSACLVTLLVAGFLLAATHSSAQESATSVLTFNQPFEVPGHVFPAGTYTFTIGEANSSRNLVRVFNKDKSKLLASVMTVPEYRETRGKAAILFNEAARGRPNSVRAWFQDGANVGHRFVYAASSEVVPAAQ